jgi:hypothetical protein
MIDKSNRSFAENAERMLSQKVTQIQIERVLDEVFPFIKADEDSSHNKANEQISYTREVFMKDCMGASDVANYTGTNYQIFNALTDFTQHYYKGASKGLDLESRMNLIPGIGTVNSTNPIFKVQQFLKIADKIAA